jgi:acylphosphatase
MPTVCKQVTYSGRVQGVGFRYTARRLASEFPVAGYVRNLGNGDVELLAEGDEAQVAAFLNAIAVSMQGYTTGIVVRDDAPGGYASFEIRH